MTPLESRLSYRCSMITARIARFLSPMWHDRYGLSVESWRILAVIGRYEPISAKEVATRSSSDAYHISRSVERLVRNGLVARNVDRKDRRRIRLQLTPAGRSAHTTIVRALTNVESELLVGLAPKERDLLTKALAIIDERALALIASGLSWKDFLGSRG